MDNKLSQLIKDRLIQSSEVIADLLKFCELQIVIVQQQSAIQIRSPNYWTEKQLCDRLLPGSLAQLLYSMGVEAVILYYEENFYFYYCHTCEWNWHRFELSGYFNNGDLNNLTLIDIPSIEELEKWADDPD